MPRKTKTNWGTKCSVKRASTRTQVPVEQHNVSWEAAGHRDRASEKKARYDHGRYERMTETSARSSSSSSSSSSSGGGGGAGRGTACRLASSGVSAIQAFSFGVGATAGVDGGGVLGGGGGGGGGDGRNC